MLIKDGHIDQKELERESLTREELLAVVHIQGFEDIHRVRTCHLEPNGTFYVEGFDPSVDEKRHGELTAKIDALAKELALLRPQTSLNPEV